MQGMTLLWLTTVIPQARPPPCDQSSNNCIPPTAPQLFLLCFSFGLMSIGAAGIRSSSVAFGADQLVTLKSPGSLERYFSWYFVTVTSSVVVALTFIVYLQEHSGWNIGFGVPVVLMLVSAVSFFLASSLYIKVQVRSSVFTSFAQVLVATYRNRHLPLPSETAGSVYGYREGSMMALPSQKLRFLNKACIVRDPIEDTDGWKLCTVDQVEELKALIKIIPMWSTMIGLGISVSQHSFPVLQASSMDRHLTPSFEIPAASFSMFLVISITIWIPLYDSVILPLASRVLKKRVRLCPKTRMGVGLLIIFVSMVVIATVENIRRSKAAGDQKGPVPMSALWLIPQYCLIGLAEAFTAVGQNEFYFSEFPKSMASIATTLGGVGGSAANILGSLIMNAVNEITGRGGKASWVSSDINKGHYDYYYLVLAGICLVNIVYFLACSRAYGPCVGEAGSGKEELEGE